MARSRVTSADGVIPVGQFRDAGGQQGMGQGEKDDEDARRRTKNDSGNHDRGLPTFWDGMRTRTPCRQGWGGRASGRGRMLDPGFTIRLQGDGGS